MGHDSRWVRVEQVCWDALRFRALRRQAAQQKVVGVGLVPQEVPVGPQVVMLSAAHQVRQLDEEAHPMVRKERASLLSEVQLPGAPETRA
jgi:hypothetical protein